jgi:hypothetical protein
MNHWKAKSRSSMARRDFSTPVVELNGGDIFTLLQQTARLGLDLWNAANDRRIRWFVRDSFLEIGRENR